MSRFVCGLVVCAGLLSFLSATPAKAAVLEQQPYGIVVPVQDASVALEVWADNIIRVAYPKVTPFLDRKSLAVKPRQGPTPPWRTSHSGNQITITTAKLTVRINTVSGAVTFLDRQSKPILAEKDGGRTITPAEVQGERTFHVQQQWAPNADESLYGLGENQIGLLDIKGYDLDLWQHNGTVVVPLLVSSRGYGILWDNTSFTRFGDLRPFEAIPAAQLFDREGKPGGLTGSYYAGAHFDQFIAQRTDAKIDIYFPAGSPHPNRIIHPDLPDGDVSVRWEGELEPAMTGEYLFQTFSNNGIKLWLDDQLVINHWRQFWLPWKDLARVHLDAKRRYRLRLEWTKDQSDLTAVNLVWKTPSPEPATSLWSEVGDGIDYYFIYGPELDKVIAGYRQITGAAPMMPVWAFGLWQSRQRYKTAQESLDAIDAFRSRGIPFDNIVQDWFYWKESAWGSHQFDPTRFPDPEGWIRTIHQKHAQLMISVWGKFYPGTDNFEAMHSRGFLYEPNLREGIHDWVGYPDTFYDAFNPEARKLFWSQINRELFRKDVDAWWMDATEPDLLPTPTLEGQRTHMNPTALGTGARVLNAYPLVNSEGIYEGQREAAPQQRVFILTRSAFAGQQRYAAATWSGDTSSTWTALRAQISAGLGFCLSGIPYWTMDIGGFSVPARFSAERPKPEDVEEWRELYTRWFEFGAFTPLLRSHGEFPNREMWFFGGESDPAYQAQLKFDRLRYRLLPYVYSLAADVTRSAGTMMRALVMDFPADRTAREAADEYMFGPAFLVCPVSNYKARSRPIYLPSGVNWYDFWSGGWNSGGQTVDAPAPYDSMPLYVRAGAIVPFGPEIQYTTEKKSDPITLFIYQGSDGDFTLYEDDGLTYAYEKGAFTRIPIHWNDAAKTLTIGKREGSSAGALSERIFHLVLVSKQKPVPFSFTPRPDRTLHYSGDRVLAKAD
jgi:alpha-D-xyloside xylohydrolase